jgi:hypothetical protein
MSPTAWSVWVGVGIALCVATMLLFGLVAYTSIEGLDLVRSRVAPSENFVLLGMAVSQAGLLRSLGMLIGISLAGGGLLVSFLTIKEAVELNLNKAPEAHVTATPSLGLKSTSPGSIAVVLGSVIVVAALYASTRVNLEPQTRIGSVAESPTPVAPVNTDPLPSIDAIRKQALPGSTAASGSTK